SHASPAAHDPSADAPGRRVRLDGGDRDLEPPARAARASRADRLSARDDARGTYGRRGARARPPGLPSPGPARRFARRRDGARGRGRGEQQRHARPPRAHLAALAATTAARLRRHAPHHAAHAHARAGRRGALGRSHHRREPGGRARVAPPARIEGLSIALLETMALGLPAVASRAGGNPDVITSGETGVLVSPLDPLAWAGALERVLGDREFAQRIARAGRDRVRREFTLERTAERTEAVYREALERRRG